MLLAALKDYSQGSARALIAIETCLESMEMKSAYIQNVSVEYSLNEFRLLVAFTVGRNITYVINSGCFF